MRLKNALIAGIVITSSVGLVLLAKACSTSSGGGSCGSGGWSDCTYTVVVPGTQTSCGSAASGQSGSTSCTNITVTTTDYIWIYQPIEGGCGQQTGYAQIPGGQCQQASLSGDSCKG